MQVTCERDGLCRMGWATRAAAYEIGKDKRSFGYGSTGKKSHGGSFEDYGKAFGKVDTALILQVLTASWWTRGDVTKADGSSDALHFI